ETGKREVPTVGKPIAGHIGGPFTLVDHNGDTVTDADFHGRFMLIYFGYTFCPDVCPTAAIMMTHTLEELGEQEAKVTPIIISIDPERDRPDGMKDYTSHFHPRMVGLTGSPEQVAVAIEAYKVYAVKVFEEGWGVDDYFVYHSDVIYFMGPDGEYLDHFGSGSTPKVMAARMRAHMGGSPPRP
ncbi:MAG: SCO family protein, partial [Alphaproteobacteria bacterium]|nr:SCO family protein [Alphaproteobacteria bacterium]